MATQYTVEAAAHVDAPPDRVYGIIADYDAGHPSILPKAFRNFSVERGGVGAGTVIRFEVHTFGTTTRFHGVVTEPEPGRVLVESYDEPSPSQTTFTVVPGANGGTDVTFFTALTSRDGLAGRIERFLSRRLLKRLYAEELQNLASAAGPSTKA
jgi:hypothetical protein